MNRSRTSASRTESPGDGSPPKSARFDDRDPKVLRRCLASRFRLHLGNRDRTMTAQPEQGSKYVVVIGMLVDQRASGAWRRVIRWLGQIFGYRTNCRVASPHPPEHEDRDRSSHKQKDHDDDEQQVQKRLLRAHGQTSGYMT